MNLVWYAENRDGAGWLAEPQAWTLRNERETLNAISKQMSLPPFVFLEAIRHIRHFFYWQSFQGITLHPLAIIHMEDINVLDFDDKSERNLCFFFGNLGIIFNGASAQLFPPREKW